MNQYDFWDGYEQGRADKQTGQSGRETGKRIGRQLVQLIVAIITLTGWLVMGVLRLLWKAVRLLFHKITE